MGRRKIEIKAIKDDRNRSVTFLKRKGGLFKKAHELSVLCSVDVAVFIFGSNKKLYEYSSTDMRELITRYTYHGGVNEHKGPSDFNGGEDDDDDDIEGTPPHGHEGSVEPQMIPQHFQGQPPFPHLRHHTPSASPPINGMQFIPRGHTPQPQMIPRPSSRNDRIPPNVTQAGAPVSQPVMNGYAYVPQPAAYNHPPQSSLQHGPPPAPAQYYPAATHPPQIPAYIEEARRSAGTPNYPPPQPPARPPPQPSPPQVHVQQLPPQPVPHTSPPQPSNTHLEVPIAVPQKHPHVQVQHMPDPPAQSLAPMDPPRSDRLHDRPAQPGLDTSIIRRLPRGNQSGSIFTPIDNNQSILDQVLDSFHTDAQVKDEASSRAQSVDVGAVSRIKSSNSPPIPQRSNTGAGFIKARGSVSNAPEGGFTPPSRSNSLKIEGASRPRLRVQIPDEASDAGSNTGEPATTTSPRVTADASAQPPRRNGVDAPRLPPPSPSATSILSAGATGPPNPFARPAPQTHTTGMNIDTPVSALPSRFLNNEYLPSPSSFYPEWGFRGDNSNTLPSPLNFATPVAGSGPSFLRDESGPSAAKRKSPDISTAGPHSENHEGFEPKRIKVDG
ncbi:hypothetical protein F5B22DRAFT_543035 [Xylaria bambusicola]|uniref:uncharacterized protein n=1 Tax=Xylaria bambusicola TaxID=326684 RepID=UPI002008D697|nr:uncharacterized protein F5B22DRAFT_543035 [Xylaria bambusicola]KAI0521574.1 hypothetical protein F5B22DRAFT_543035 [Xylaria bambusicola]